MEKRTLTVENLMVAENSCSCITKPCNCSQQLNGGLLKNTAVEIKQAATKIADKAENKMHDKNFQKGAVVIGTLGLLYYILK